MTITIEGGSSVVDWSAGLLRIKEPVTLLQWSWNRTELIHRVSELTNILIYSTGNTMGKIQIEMNTGWIPFCYCFQDTLQLWKLEVQKVVLFSYELPRWKLWGEVTPAIWGKYIFVMFLYKFIFFLFFIFYSGIHVPLMVLVMTNKYILQLISFLAHTRLVHVIFMPWKSEWAIRASSHSIID